MKRPSLTEKAYREIRNGIARHIIKPGSLMTTKELADLLHMSQTPIREALCILEHEHFVVRRPKRGYAVNEMDITEFIDLYDMRLAIEVRAIELAAEKITAAGIAKMETVLSELSKKKPKINIMEGEQDFHIIILESAENALMEETGKRILDRLWMVQKIVLHNSEHWLESHNHHLALFNEIKVRRGKQASEIMKKHLLWGKQLVLSRIEDADDFLHSFFHHS